LVISNNSLRMNKEEFNKRREARLFISAKWTGDKIYVSRYFKGQKIESIAKEDLYEGIEGFITLSVTNTSDHAISIDGMGIGYCAKNSIRSIPWGGKFKSVDMQDNIAFPIILNPYEPFRCVTRIPIPVSARMVGVMNYLQSDSTYSSIDVLRELLYFLTTGRNNIDLRDSIEANINNRLQEINEKGWIRNVPELLIAYSDSDPSLRVMRIIRGQRAIEVAVKLSSGELISKTLDYMDIGRSPFDMLSPQE
ncbi:MAG TPA: hypothetical protein VMT04_07075, partial [Terriglobales bacterium]|nr:hypothetical protein [Terriglobales bacterium]